MLSNHCILCCLLLLRSIFPRIRVFSSESALRIGWPKYWSFSFSTSPSNEYSGLISFRTDFWSPCSPGDSQKSSSAHQFQSINSSVLSLLYGPTLTSVRSLLISRGLQTFKLKNWTAIMIPLSGSIWNGLGESLAVFILSEPVINQGFINWHSHICFPNICSINFLRASVRPTRWQFPETLTHPFLKLSSTCACVQASDPPALSMTS